MDSRTAEIAYFEAQGYQHEQAVRIADNDWPKPPPQAANGQAANGQHPEPTQAQVRAWAKGEGYQVNQRGSLPAWMYAEYDKAHRLKAVS